MPSDDNSRSSSDRSSEEDGVDQEPAERISQAIAELQGSMDAALLAGPVVEPKFVPADNRLARFGTRMDSSVCRVRLYRRLA